MIKELNGKTPDVERAVFVAETASVVGEVILHEDSSVWYGAVLRADIAKIEIGRGSNIQDGTVCHVDHDKPVMVGRDVTVGHNVVLHGCQIGDRALIGMGATILDSVVIGNESLVGAGAVVTPGTVIPPRSLVLGSPAKVKRQLTEEEIDKMKKNSSAYVELAKHHNIS